MLPRLGREATQKDAPSVPFTMTSEVCSNQSPLFIRRQPEQPVGEREFSLGTVDQFFLPYKVRSPTSLPQNHQKHSLELHFLMALCISRA